MNMMKVLLVAVLLLLSLCGFAMSIWQGLTLPPHSSPGIKLRKAFLTGLGIVVCFVSGVIAIDYLASPDAELHWGSGVLGGLLCFILPMALITIVGSYLWFSRQEATQQYFATRLRRIIERSKKADHK